MIVNKYKLKFRRIKMQQPIVYQINSIRQHLLRIKANKYNKYNKLNKYKLVNKNHKFNKKRQVRTHNNLQKTKQNNINLLINKYIKNKIGKEPGSTNIKILLKI